jgi:hypothetical protein
MSHGYLQTCCASPGPVPGSLGTRSAGYQFDRGFGRRALCLLRRRAVAVADRAPGRGPFVAVEGIDVRQRLAGIVDLQSNAGIAAALHAARPKAKRTDGGAGTPTSLLDSPAGVISTNHLSHPRVVWYNGRNPGRECLGEYV